MQSIGTYSFEGKKALIRVDYNVPLDSEFNVTDDSRIKATIETVNAVINGGGAVILMSHFGRPKNGPEDKFSLRHIVSSVEKNLGKSVIFATDSVGEDANMKAANLKSGEVLLLENVRFNAGEGKGDTELAKQMAALGDCFIFDAFGAAHRAGSSTSVVASFFPNDKMFGYVMERELESTRKILDTPERPYVAIVGGAKVSSKITVIERLMEKVDRIIIGGGMAYTFHAAKGGKIGNSLCETDMYDTALNILSKAKELGVELFISEDTVCADDFSNSANSATYPSNNIPEGWMGMDTGTKGTEVFANAIKDCKTILWNGPVGVFEMDNFAAGSKAVAEAIVTATSNGAFSLIGGGDSVACINKFNLGSQVSYCSTGGGALLEYLEGKTLPAVAAILE